MNPTNVAWGGSAREAHPHHQAVDVLVNFKTVTLPTERLTGLAIKEAAIAQGVSIQVDFVLFEDHGHGRRDLIRDDQVVHVHRGERFEAIPGDDNS